MQKIYSAVDVLKSWNMPRYCWLVILLLASLACNLTFEGTPTMPPATLIPITAVYEGTKTCTEIFPAAQPGRTHMVQPGESLSLIASWYGTSLDELIQLNAIADPAQLEIGQLLLVQRPDPFTAQPGEIIPPLNTVTVEPYPLREGETSCITLITQLPTQITATFLDLTVPVITGSGGVQHFLLIPVPLSTTVGTFPVILTMQTERGEISTTSLNLQIQASAHSDEFLFIENTALLDLALEQAELLSIRTLTSGFTPVFSGKLALPINQPISSPYGSRRFYNEEGQGHDHLGVDFSAPPATSVMASGSGTVVFVGEMNIRGKVTIIDHGWGIYTLYAHQAEQRVTVGQVVSIGQEIGIVGSTGRSTGAHLHWEAWVNGTAVNPLQWIGS